MHRIEKNILHHAKKQREQRQMKNKLTNDDTRDIAIRCVDKLIELNLLDKHLLDLEYSWEAQDTIHDIINKSLDIN